MLPKYQIRVKQELLFPNHIKITKKRRGDRVQNLNHQGENNPHFPCPTLIIFFSKKNKDKSSRTVLWTTWELRTKSYLPSIREDFVGQLFTFVFWKHTEETGELNYWISAAKRCYSVGHRHQTEFRREQTKLLLLSCAAKLDALCGWDTDNNAARQTPSNFSRIFLLYSSTISTLIWREK